MGRVHSWLPSLQHAGRAAITLTALSSSLDFNVGDIHTHYLHHQSNKKTFRPVFDSSVNVLAQKQNSHLNGMKAVEMRV